MTVTSSNCFFCPIIYLVTYTCTISLNIFGKVFLSCSLAYFQNSNSVMFPVQHLFISDWFNIWHQNCQKKSKIQKFHFLIVFARWTLKIRSLPERTELVIYCSRQVFTSSSLFIEIQFSSFFTLNQLTTWILDEF